MRFPTIPKLPRAAATALSLAGGLALVTAASGTSPWAGIASPIAHFTSSDKASGSMAIDHPGGIGAGANVGVDASLHAATSGTTGGGNGSGEHAGSTTIKSTRSEPTTTMKPASTEPTKPEPTTTTTAKPASTEPTTTQTNTSSSTETHTPPTISLNCVAVAHAVTCTWGGGVSATFGSWVLLRTGQEPRGRVPFSTKNVTVTSYVDTAVAAGATYHYGIIALDAQGHVLAHGPDVVVTVPAAPPAPPAPPSGSTWTGGSTHVELGAGTTTTNPSTAGTR